MHPFDALYRWIISTFKLRKLAIHYAKARTREARRRAQAAKKS